MPYTTAIFYDVENLLKGYAFSAETLANLSLREIIEAVSRTGRLSSVAVQRAYANWSDPRLGVMRGELNELGIEPIQVFGFARERTKNAADIQLAIDAIDLAHVRPSLEVFVIVSGDGGFAALAKKLHEYGKVVVGCGYASASSRVFQAVCDEFVAFPDPEGERRTQLLDAVQGSTDGPQVTTPLVRRMAGAVKRVETSDRETVIAKAKEVLRWIGGDAESRRVLSGEGLHLSVLAEAIRYAVPGFEPTGVGFAKFVEFAQYLCAGSSLCVARCNDGSVILASRSAGTRNVHALPDLGEDYVQSAENYRSVLGSGFPVFRLPEPRELTEVASWVSEASPQDVELGTIIETAANGLGWRVSSESIKRALLCFISAGVFDRRPDGVPLSEQTLTLRPSFRTGDDIVDAVGAAIEEKLRATLGGVRKELLEALLPSPPDRGGDVRD